MVRSRLRRLLDPPKRDDAAVAYRLTTLGLVFVSVTAAVLQQAVPTSAGTAALVLVPIGYYFSYRRRAKRNVLLKVALAAALFIAFATFIQAIRGATTVDETRAPLVALFLWVQVLHSFDLPRARDLTFSVAASVALIALAGSLSFSSGFLILVIVYTALLIGALIFGHEAELRAQARSELGRELSGSEQAVAASGSKAPMLRGAAALVASLLIATSVVFVFLPRFPGLSAGALPFAISRRASIAGLDGNIVNPGRNRGGGGRAAGFDPFAYFGYGSSMDLHVRGRLSNELVMRVRSPRPALYRAQAYDTYADGRWTSSERTLKRIARGGLPSISIPASPDQPPGGDELVQTFYVERELPNVIFHAYHAREVYTSSDFLRTDSASSLRLPFTLEKDTIYSVVSETLPEPGPNAFTPDDLASPGPEFARYLDVPGSLGPRFTELARKITATSPTPVEKAHAVEGWIHRNKRYRLDIPRDPPGQDPVDVFVFDRRDGFCEQIASTMALMLRASGVPTRLVTGFGSGDRNLFTGYWEVRNSDSHAWVEVYYRGVGWVTYDPTFGVPQSSVANTTFMFKPLARAFSKFLPTGAVRSLFAAISRIAHVPSWAAPVVALAFAAIVVVGSAVTLARRRRASLRPSDRVVLAWLEVETHLRKRKLVRAPPETVVEFARRAADSELAELAEEFGRLRYGMTATDDDVVLFEDRVHSVLTK